MKLLKELCQVHAPSGNELKMKEFILKYIDENSKKWNVQPEIIQGNELQDCIILKFGDPKVAVFAHMDSIGFTVRYNKELIKIGGPKTEEGFELIGTDSKGNIDAELMVIENEQGKKRLEYIFKYDKTGNKVVTECVGSWSDVKKYKHFYSAK